MIQEIPNLILLLVLTGLAGSGLGFLLREISQRFVTPTIALVNTRIDRHLAQPENRWKATVLQRLYEALDPVLPSLLNQFGSEEVAKLLTYMAQTYAGGQVPSSAIDEVVNLYRQRFDPLRQNLNPSPLSEALEQAIAAYRDDHPDSQQIVGGPENLTPFIPEVLSAASS